MMTDVETPNEFEASNENVFINCPFDADYNLLFEAIVFTVIRCGCRARCAKESEDGATVRIEKIQNIIKECRFGIHDISRTELDAINQLPRFNMPFELGLFLGARRFGDATQAAKTCLIMDREPYRFQKFLSDISGQDPSSHMNDLSSVLTLVLNFLRSHHQGTILPRLSELRHDFDYFDRKIRDHSLREGIPRHMIPFWDLVGFFMPAMIEAENARAQMA